MEASVSVAGGFVKATATVADRHAAIIITSVGVALVIAGLVMLSRSPAASAQAGRE